MIESPSANKKRVLATINKNKNNLPYNLNLNHLLPFAKDRKNQNQKAQTHRLNGKENKNMKKSIHIQEFPEFVQFKSNENIPKSRNDKINSSLEQSFGKRYIAIPDYQSKSKQQKNNFKDYTFHKESDFKGIMNKTTVKAYAKKFQLAIQKIFKGLDIFNRGRISETNINKWIPQSALYFLGSVFQKIRQQRLSLSEQEFLRLCHPLLEESNEQDIQWFIEQVSGKQAQFNISIDMTEEDPLSSPVIMKNDFSKNKKERNQLNSNNQGREVLDYNIILENIKDKERELQIRLNSIKDKQRKGPIDQLVNKPKQTNTMNSNNQSNQYNLNQNIFKKQKQILSDKKQVKTKQNRGRAQPNTINLDQKIKWQAISPEIPVFTFQIAQSNKEPRLTIKKQQYSNKEMSSRGQISKNESRQLAETPRPMTSRIVRQNILKQFSNSSRKKEDPQDTSRLDRLSNKLQDYLKFNQQKLQKNRQFIRENSIPKR